MIKKQTRMFLYVLSAIIALFFLNSDFVFAYDITKANIMPSVFYLSDEYRHFEYLEPVSKQEWQNMYNLIGEKSYTASSHGEGVVEPYHHSFGKKNIQGFWWDYQYGITLEFINTGENPSMGVGIALIEPLEDFNWNLITLNIQPENKQTWLGYKKNKLAFHFNDLGNPAKHSIKPRFIDSNIDVNAADFDKLEVHNGNFYISNYIIGEDKIIGTLFLQGKYSGRPFLQKWNVELVRN